jgi:hypothetical protein
MTRPERPLTSDLLENTVLIVDRPEWVALVWNSRCSSRPTSNKQEDIHTLLGLIAGLPQSNRDSELTALLVEQLKGYEADSDDSTVPSQLSPENRQQLIAEIQSLLGRVDDAGDAEKLEWLRGMLEYKLKSLGNDG